MKRNRILFNIIGLFAAAAALLATACERDPMVDADDNSEYVEVTFTLQPEDLVAVSTRAEAWQPDGKLDYEAMPHISDGTKANVLIYAVYDEDFNLLSEFGQDNEAGDILLPDGTPLGLGQTMEEVETFPHKIILTVKRDKTYNFAFWAQNSSCKAYDVHDLKRVQIHYSEIEAVSDESNPNASSTPNNDEMRDAFCTVEKLKIENKSINKHVVFLYRPLAQINVGTTGYDYEDIVQDEDFNYAYTRIQIASAPRYLNVVEDKIETDKSVKDNYSALEYGWALMPAYANADWATSHGKTDGILGEIADGSISSVNLQQTYEWEEFLKVKIYDDVDRETTPYLPYAGLDNNNERTETFKYLSMCYVLAASDKSTDEAGNTTYGRSAFDRVRVWIATDKTGANEKTLVDIVDVPATRNWRTNIVGNILTTDVTFNITLDPIYAGDYNGFYDEGEISWSGPLNGLDGGAFYDAENDEILISNVKGLLWLQQMVNGDLVYRNDANRNGSVEGDTVAAGSPIYYYDENGDEHWFGDESTPYYFKGIPDPTTDPKLEEGTPEYEAAAMLKERILIATHQKYNKAYNPEKNDTWPKYNNFHFVGEEDGEPYPANVKLVADIDLSGIEWLGIGFDCKTDQTRDMLGDNGTNNRNSLENNHDKKQHRGFFGHFDGNGHTVSNLKTKRFAVNVHEKSLQLGTGGPYEAVQWFARGFFGQLGGTAKVENLTLHNVDIYGFNCVGGIAGAAIGVKGGGNGADEAKQNGGTVIDIDNCVVDGGTITTVPMYRGDAWAQGKQHLRTYARGVNTGGIVGLYNANGSVTNCDVRNLTICGYRITGGIVGCIGNYYLAYTSTDWNTATVLPNSNTPFDSPIKMQAITGNRLVNTVIMSNRSLPFDTMKAGEYTEKTNNCYSSFAYGFSWQYGYSSFLHNIVGGQYGGDDLGNDNSDNDGHVNTHFLKSLENNDISGAQVIDFANDVLYDEQKNKILGRVVYLDNAPVDVLPVLNNWFCDFVDVKSNLIGNAALYKRYKTHSVEMFLPNNKGNFTNVMWSLPGNYNITWDEESGLVGMRVGAVVVDGHDADKNCDYILSVRGATGEKDCAVQISSCNREEFTKTAAFLGNKVTPSDWATIGETVFKNLTVRGNPFAYTGICLSPNKCMKSITIDEVAIYDVYRTIALDKMDKKEGYWPNEVVPDNVTLTVSNSDLRGYTVPGAGWKSITYDTVTFERSGATSATGGSAENDEKRHTCDVEATTEGTTFTDCTFKAPYIINIAEGAKVTFTNCKATFATSETAITLPEGGNCKQIVVDAAGAVEYK